MSKLCCYWEGSSPPAYLAWCMSTWTDYVDLDEVLFLNHSNTSRYLGDLIDVEKLKRFSFAKQSDIVSAAYLYKYGGLFIDVDTILANNNARTFLAAKEQDDVFRFFGNAATMGVHIGVISSPRQGTIVSAWQEELFDRVANWESDNSWAYVGNQILDPLINDPKMAAYSQRFDVADNLATPELQFALAPADTAREKYEGFWFTQEVDPRVVASVRQAPGGIISLHNSWTPPSFSELQIDALKASGTMLSALLSELGDASLVPQIQERVYFGS